MAQGGLFVFQGKINGQDKMDVLFVAGIDTATGNMKREKLIRCQLQLFQQECPDDGIIVIQRDGKISQSQHK